MGKRGGQNWREEKREGGEGNKVSGNFIVTPAYQRKKLVVVSSVVIKFD